MFLNKSSRNTGFGIHLSELIGLNFILFTVIKDNILCLTVQFMKDVCNLKVYVWRLWIKIEIYLCERYHNFNF